MKARITLSIVISILLTSLFVAACASIQSTNTAVSIQQNPTLTKEPSQIQICDISIEQDGSWIRFDGEVWFIDYSDPDFIELQFVDPMDTECEVWIWIEKAAFRSWDATTQEGFSVGNILEITGVVYEDMGMMVVQQVDSASQVSVLETSVPTEFAPPTISTGPTELHIPQVLLPWTENYGLVIGGNEYEYFAATKDGVELGIIDWEDEDTPTLYAESVESVQEWLVDLGGSSSFDVTEKPEMVLSAEDLYTTLTIHTENLIILNDITVALPGSIWARPVGIWHSFTYDQDGNVHSADLDFVLVGSHQFMHIEQLLPFRPRISLFLGCSQTQFDNYLDLKETSSDFWVPQILYDYRWLIDHYGQENLIDLNEGTLKAWIDFMDKSTFDANAIQRMVYLYLY